MPLAHSDAQFCLRKVVEPSGMGMPHRCRPQPGFCRCKALGLQVTMAMGSSACFLRWYQSPGLDHNWSGKIWPENSAPSSSKQAGGSEVGLMQPDPLGGFSPGPRSACRTCQERPAFHCRLCSHKSPALEVNPGLAG